MNCSLQITGSPIHKPTTGRSTPPLRSRSGTVTPTSNNAGVAIAPQIIQVKGVDNKLVQVIMDEIVEGGAKVRWSDIAGQEVSSFGTLSVSLVHLILKLHLRISGCKTSASGNGYTAIRSSRALYRTTFTSQR